MILRCNSLYAPIKNKSVHCVITSPPYWSLRDYGTAKWEGGNSDCDHRKEEIRIRRNLAKAAEQCDGNPRNQENRGDNNALWLTYRDVCEKCGAVRVDSQLGLEKTPEEYVQNMVQVFREVWRVLRDDGTLWLNMGDSYATAPASSGISFRRDRASVQPCRSVAAGLKPKDLCGIPWRLAFALQAAGWYLRSDIIWSKANPMPESVTDRPTKSHEYIFLLTKSPHYFFDQEAVREKQVDISICRNKPVRANHGIGNTSSGGRREGFEKHGRYAEVPGGRNIRTVWSIPTQSFSGAHFATFPEELVRRCLFAGTSEKGCCPKCGGPWVRTVKKSGGTIGTGWHDHSVDSIRGQRLLDQDASHGRHGKEPYKVESIGWRPSCECGEERTVPAMVFDPFFGSGTVGVVAQKYNRRFIGLELKPEYCQMARKRVNSQPVAMI